MGKGLSMSHLLTMAFVGLFTLGLAAEVIAFVLMALDIAVRGVQ